MLRSIATVLTFILLMGVISLNYSKVQAQTNDLSSDDIFSMDLEELMAVEITTGNKRSESLLETPAYIQVLTEEDLRIMNFNTLDEVFDYLLGSQTIRGEGNMFTTTTFRGNTLTHYNVNSLLLFDGIPFYNMYNGTFDFSLIPVSSIKQIEILKGSNSVLYGTSAMNATINVIPKKSTENETVGTGRIRYGDNNTLVGQNAVYGKKDKVSYGIFTDLQMTEGELLEYEIRNSDKVLELRNAKKVGSIAGYVEWNNFKLNINSTNRSLYHIDNNLVDTVLYLSGDDEFSIVYPNKADEYQNMFSLSYHNSITDKISFSARANYQNYNLYQKVNAKEQQYHSHGYFNEVEVVWTPSDNAHVTFGTHYNWYIGYRKVERMQNGVRSVEFNVAPDKIPTNDIAFYLNGNYKFNKFNFYYGGRYYASSYDGNVGSNFSPRLALTYSVNEDLTLKAIYGRSFRVPGYFEKGSLSRTAYGNPGLQSEISDSYDFVVAGKSEKFTYSADFFVSTIANKIVREAPTAEDIANTGQDISLIYKNTPGGLFYGAELSAKLYLSNKFSAFAGYSYVNAINEDDDPDVLGDDLWLFEHMANLGLRYRILSFMEINFSGRFISDWGPADGNVVANMGVNLFPQTDSRFSLEFMVNNLFNQTVYMPEIANRRIEQVATTMKTRSRQAFVSLTYSF